MEASLSRLEIALVALGTFAIYKISQALLVRSRTTKLHGPPAPSWLFGVSRETFHGDSGALYEEWADRYGVVFQVPTSLGGKKIVLCDPKAISHFYASETFTYVQTPIAKTAISQIVGKGLLMAEGESHRRQRKALTPAFSNTAIRNLSSVFYDSAYKVKGAWDSILEANSYNDAIIDVQSWMNHVSLDTIGIAGFSHNFGALEGKHSAVADLFGSFGNIKVSRLAIIQPLLSPVMPFIIRMPTSRTKLVNKLHQSMGEIADVLLHRSRNENAAESAGKTSVSRSIIGALLKSETAGTQLSMSEEEIRSQMKTMILAGYETTSVSLTWALIELSAHQDKQDKLRETLPRSSAGDPSYDQLTNGLPYLDAVMREVLRLHPPLPETPRIAVTDDIIPLSAPLTTSSGQTVDHISVAKGSVVTVPIRSMNRSARIWGPDAKEFKPERWIDEEGIPPKALELQGYHHLLTFSEGPRMCLGKAFAVAEFKAVLSVLIRHYKFELRDGPETKIELVRAVLFRPKVAGEEGAKVPLRVSHIE